MSLSAWLTQAAEAKLRQDRDASILEEAQQRRSKALGAYLGEGQAEHGAFTQEEMARARRTREAPNTAEARGGEQGLGDWLLNGMG